MPLVFFKKKFDTTEQVWILSELNQIREYYIDYYIDYTLVGMR